MKRSGREGFPPATGLWAAPSLEITFSLPESASQDMKCAFQVHPKDNVATMLDDADGTIQLLGQQPRELALRVRVSCGHKVSLNDIATGEPVIKYGVRIGHATQDIQQGEWIHLHNLASDLDERSGTLDLHSGAPTDSVYE